MKQTSIIFTTFITLLFVLLIFEQCGNNGTEEENKPPSCSITSPSNNSSINLGSTVTISVSASDADGLIANVKISIDDATVATLQSSPYTYDWNTSGVSTGQHNIKAIATDDGSLTAMAQITVTVNADAPTVTTTDVTDIADVTATSGGNVTDDGGADVTARGVVWSETSGPTLDNKTGSTSDGSGTGTFTSSLTGLTLGTTYYVKAYATNSQGTSYGEEKSFSTTGLPTVVTGDPATDITNISATCSGEVTDEGGSSVTAKGHVWGTMVNPTLDDNDGSSNVGTGTGSFSSNLTSLVSNTDYVVRAYATNGAGTAYGDPVYFKTLPGPPTITTLDMRAITAFTSIAGGEITDDGGTSTIYSGIVLGLSPNPDKNNWDFYSTFFLNPDNNTLEAFLSGLEPNTTYYYKAWVQNDYGISYGEEKSFTTSVFSVQEEQFTDSRDSRQYLTVEIEGQVWMAENLAYLPDVCASNGTCGYWVYDYQGTDLSAAKATTNFSDYGVLYSWEMAKAACPTGWHLPNDEDWSLLELNIGMPENLVYNSSNRNLSDFGDKLKETGNVHWTGTNTGTNIAKFNAVPGGERNQNDNSFQYLGTVSNFWSSTLQGVDPNDEIIYRYISGKVLGKSRYGRSNWENQGMSVRCIQD